MKVVFVYCVATKIIQYEELVKLLWSKTNFIVTHIIVEKHDKSRWIIKKLTLSDIRLIQ